MNLSAILSIASNTFHEAIRLRFLNVVWILGILLIASSLAFRRVHFGGAEINFLFDFGHGAIFVFGAILSIFLSAQVFFREIDNRTVLMILSRPVQPWAFLVGKTGGVILVMTLFTVLMAAVLALLLVWRWSPLPDDPDAVSGTLLRNLLQLHLAATLLQWIKFVLLTVMVLAICSFASSSLFAMFAGLALLIICQLQHIPLSLQATDPAGWTGTLIAFAGRLFPDFSMLNPENLGLAAGLPGARSWGFLGLYSGAYFLLYLVLSLLFFHRREI